MNKVRGISAGLAVVVLTAGFAFAHQESSGHGGSMEGCMGGSERHGGMKGEGTTRGGMMSGGMMGGGMMSGGMMGGTVPNAQWRGTSAP